MSLPDLGFSFSAMVTACITLLGVVVALCLGWWFLMRSINEGFHWFANTFGGHWGKVASKGKRFQEGDFSSVKNIGVEDIRNDD